MGLQWGYNEMLTRSKREIIGVTTRSQREHIRDDNKVKKRGHIKSDNKVTRAIYGGDYKVTRVLQYYVHNLVIPTV